LDYAFKRSFGDNISYVDILEIPYEVIYEFRFFFAILYDGASFMLDKLFLDYDIDNEGSMI